MNQPMEKLGETKRQHYVPRMILRRFSKDGKRISLVVAGKRIDGASIGKQCYGDYFHGSDNVMEKSFADSEAKMASFLGDLAPARFANLTDEDVHELRMFLAYQYIRTDDCRAARAAPHDGTAGSAPDRRSGK